MDSVTGWFELVPKLTDFQAQVLLNQMMTSSNNLEGQRPVSDEKTTDGLHRCCCCFRQKMRRLLKSISSQHIVISWWSSSYDMTWYHDIMIYHQHMTILPSYHPNMCLLHTLLYLPVISPLHLNFSNVLHKSLNSCFCKVFPNPRLGRNSLWELKAKLWEIWDPELHPSQLILLTSYNGTSYMDVASWWYKWTSSGWDEV